MQEHIYFATIIFPLLTILIVFGMKYMSATIQSRARLADEERYRTLAESNAAYQQDSLATLEQLKGEMANASARIAQIETILKQVE